MVQVGHELEVLTEMDRETIGQCTRPLARLKKIQATANCAVGSLVMK